MGSSPISLTSLHKQLINNLMIKETKVLDHGYVKLTHKMIDQNDDEAQRQSLDEMAVAAARVSYGGDLKGEEKDKRLLHYLIEHEHGSPLESAVMRFEVKLPIFVMRQWIRHRWAGYNEISGRYTENISDDFYVPTEFRAQDTKNKQGSVGGEIKPVPQYDPMGGDYEEKALVVYTNHLLEQQHTYQLLIDAGVAKEMARMVLGTAFYTKFVWTVNARALMNFLILRCDSHAQWEMRQYAWAIHGMMKEEMPWLIEGLEKYFPQSFVK